MAKATDPRIKVLRLSLKEALAKQGITLGAPALNDLANDIIAIDSLADCGGGGCKRSCNTGCSDGCKDSSKTA